MKDTQLPAIARLALREMHSELSISRYKLDYLSADIGQLTRLTKLDLSWNHLTSLPSEIGNLSKIRDLNLSNNQLSSLPAEIGQLVNLERLDVNNNKLISLPAQIHQLVNLKELNISNNEIEDFPLQITELISLITLQLSNNKLKSLPSKIENLIKLEYLFLSGNKLSSLPKELGKLINLNRLYLPGNNLSSLPKEIGQLGNLLGLYLQANKIESLPVEIGNLDSLSVLDLAGNKLKILQPEIANLENLLEINLSSNNLKSLPVELHHLPNLKFLDLYDNPWESPPLEIVDKGLDSVKNFLRQLESDERDYVYEAKLLIVGEAGAGKTTLAKKIVNPDYELKDESTTKGIDIISWTFPFKDNQQFRVNIWDFGGQEIYHATHQFFLTKRSLYAIVADSRKEDTDFYYWSNIVSLLSKNSPLLIINNEKQDRSRQINERQLRAQFLNFKESLATNFATNRGMVAAIDCIKHYITNLPHIGSQLPKKWIKIREILERLNHRNYINFLEYLNICDNNGFSQKKDKLHLCEYLHDLGVCLHFQDDPLLKKILIINPEWATTAVYKLLDNKTIISKFGHFSLSDVEEIWFEDKYANMHAELLQLMINFRLCYKIPRTDNKYIAPQLLSDNQPKYDWIERENLIIKYRYEFMPKGIISRFIVAMHSLIENQDLVWKSGVVLFEYNTRAEIIEYQSKREISIRLVGESKRDLLIIVLYELDIIHNSFFGLKFEKMVPCNCKVCKDRQDPFFYNFETLKRYFLDKQLIIQCQKSYNMVDVINLIGETVGDTHIREIDNLPSTYPKLVVQQIFSNEATMGDQYNVTGQIGAIGKNSKSEGNVFNLEWKQIDSGSNLQLLASELELLRSAMRKEATDIEHDQAIVCVGDAMNAAKEQDSIRTLNHLKSAGKWAFNVATKIGTAVASKAIQTAIGL